MLLNVKIPCRRGVSLIYGLDGRVCKDHRGSENVQCEHDYDYKVICARGDRYALCDRDYVSDDRDYVSYDRGCVNDARACANHDHDCELYIQNEVSRFSIQDYGQYTLHARDVPATLLSSWRQADVNDENASNYGVPQHAHHYEVSA